MLTGIRGGGLGKKAVKPFTEAAAEGYPDGMKRAQRRRSTQLPEKGIWRKKTASKNEAKFRKIYSSPAWTEACTDKLWLVGPNHETGPDKRAAIRKPKRAGQATQIKGTTDTDREDEDCGHREGGTQATPGPPPGRPRPTASAQGMLAHRLPSKLQQAGWAARRVETREQFGTPTETIIRPIRVVLGAWRCF